MKTAQQAAQNWVNSAPRAQASWKQGVESYSGDWAGATVNQESAMLQGVTQAITNGTWRAGVLRAGTNGWKSRTLAKESNFAVGFTAGATRQQQAITKIMAELNSIVPGLPPRGSYEQNKMRANVLWDALHARRGQLGAG